MKIEVPIKIISLGSNGFHIAVDVLLNQEFEGQMIIDTGASNTVFDKETTEDFCEEINFDDFSEGFSIDEIEEEHTLEEIGNISKEEEEFKHCNEGENEGCQVSKNIVSAGVSDHPLEFELAKVNTFSIGDLQKENFKALIINLNHVNKIFENFGENKINGLLGSDFLVAHKAILDFETNIMTLNI